jgi:hypothetical protein
MQSTAKNNQTIFPISPFYIENQIYCIMYHKFNFTKQVLFQTILQKFIRILVDVHYISIGSVKNLA